MHFIIESLKYIFVYIALHLLANLISTSRFELDRLIEVLKDIVIFFGLSLFVVRIKLFSLREIKELGTRRDILGFVISLVIGTGYEFFLSDSYMREILYYNIFSNSINVLLFVTVFKKAT